MTKRFSIAVLCFAALATLAADANHPTGTRGLLLIDKLGSQIRFFDRHLHRTVEYQGGDQPARLCAGRRPQDGICAVNVLLKAGSEGWRLDREARVFRPAFDVSQHLIHSKI